MFDPSRTQNQWQVEAKLLREIIDYFSPSAEQLDMYPDGGKAVFTSFTNKITDGKGSFVSPLSWLTILTQSRNIETAATYIGNARQ